MDKYVNAVACNFAVEHKVQHFYNIFTLTVLVAIKYNLQFRKIL